jgi:hypothetical protein
MFEEGRAVGKVITIPLFFSKSKKQNVIASPFNLTAILGE